MFTNPTLPCCHCTADGVDVDLDDSCRPACAFCRPTRINPGRRAFTTSSCANWCKLHCCQSNRKPSEREKNAVHADCDSAGSAGSADSTVIFTAIILDEPAVVPTDRCRHHALPLTQRFGTHHRTQSDAYIYSMFTLNPCQPHDTDICNESLLGRRRPRIELTGKTRQHTRA